MKHRNTPRGGAKNKQQDLLDEHREEELPHNRANKSAPTKEKEK